VSEEAFLPNTLKKNIGKKIVIKIYQESKYINKNGIFIG
jgi:hypothetical protein